MITLSGPGGSATLDADTDLPLTILRDPRSGRVRAILRDVPRRSPVDGLIDSRRPPSAASCHSPPM